MKGKFCLLLFVGVLAVCLVGCSSKGHQTAQNPSQVPVTRIEPVPAPGAQKPIVQAQQGFAPVFFATGQSQITPQAAGVLQKEAQRLKANPGMKVEISGNADQRGSAQFNDKLAQKRADAVKNYLVSQGVNANQLRTENFGQRRPVCSDNTPGCYAENRRVDMHALG